MSHKEKLEAKLTHLKPILASAGRSISVETVDVPSVTFRVSGFCSGCACSSSYKDSLTQLVADTCPDLTTIEFIED
jgi:Fe-S cluster biogenesis protein NfuA